MADNNELATAILNRLGLTPDMSMFTQEGFDTCLEAFNKSKAAHSTERPDAKVQRDKLELEWAQVDLPAESIQAWADFKNNVIGQDIINDPRLLAGWTALTKVMFKETADLFKYNVQIAAATSTEDAPEFNADEMTEIRSWAKRIIDMSTALGKQVKFPKTAKGMLDMYLPKNRRSKASHAMKALDSTKIVQYFVEGSDVPYSAVMLPKQLDPTYTYAMMLGDLSKIGEDVFHGWDRKVTTEDAETGDVVETDEQFTVTLCGKKVTCSVTERPKPETRVSA